MGACFSDESINENNKNKETLNLKNNESQQENENKNEPQKESFGKLKRRKSINSILIQNKPPARNSSKKLTLQRKQSIKYINEYKNDDQMHNKNFLLNRLAKNLTRNAFNREEFEKKKKDEVPEYVIDWKLVRDPNMITYSWKNMGLIKLTKELGEEVARMSPDEAKNCESLYKKRIWLHFYINTHLAPSDKENPLIIVHRNKILDDSYNQFMTTTDLNLINPLQVHFVDEEAHDEGGVYREWYACLFKEFFNEKNKLFMVNPNNTAYNGTYIINLGYDKNKINYYQFFGKLIVKAIVDSVYMNEHLNLTIIKNLLNKKIELEEVKFYDLSLYKSLKTILETKISTNASLKEMTFTYNLSDGKGKPYQVELVPEGSNMYLTDENKHTFIEKVIYYETYYKYKEPMDKIKEGFYSVIKDDIIGQFYTSRELDFEIVGFKTIDLKDWKSNTIYKGIYNENHPTIKMFWEYLSKMKQEDLMKFFEFCTGLCNVPVNGFGALKGIGNKIQKFTIEPLIDYDPVTKTTNTEFKLIEAKTCFNRILLPEYKKIEDLKKAMNIILTYDSNFFGLE